MMRTNLDPAGGLSGFGLCPGRPPVVPGGVLIPLTCMARLEVNPVVGPAYVFVAVVARCDRHIRPQPVSCFISSLVSCYAYILAHAKGECQVPIKVFASLDPFFVCLPCMMFSRFL
jgi:hypothetical protein